jgi:hypothetical protein
LMLDSSTVVFGQTLVISSSLLTSSPARSTSAISISIARLPTRSGLSPSISNRRSRYRWKVPNETTRSTELSNKAASSNLRTETWREAALGTQWDASAAGHAWTTIIFPPLRCLRYPHVGGLARRIRGTGNLELVTHTAKCCESQWISVPHYGQRRDRRHVLVNRLAKSSEGDDGHSRFEVAQHRLELARTVLVT